jgi:hypothetical protein
MRATLHVDSVLQSAVDEIARSMNLAALEVHLTTDRAEPADKEHLAATPADQ